jgi:uncharacterized Zn-binding protein involved in type VI secretion
MTQPAARVGDLHTCPLSTGPVPHVGGPVLPPGAGPMTLIGGFPAARIGDQCLCVGPPDSIVKGAMPVRIAQKPAARQTDSTAHGGLVALGCVTCLIGLAGTSGNVLEGIEACQAAAAGRNPPPGAQSPNGSQLAPNTPGQSYNNCGIESSRQIINQANPGANLTQEGLFNQALANGQATSQTTYPAGNPNAGNAIPAAQQMWWSGGTTSAQQASILAANGVPATQLTGASSAASLTAMEGAVANGQGVIAGVWVGNLPASTGWTGFAPGTGGHALLVTGVEYDANGNPVNVVVNDTGQGRCGVRIPYNQFQNALIPGFTPAATVNAIW